MTRRSLISSLSGFIAGVCLDLQVNLEPVYSYRLMDQIRQVRGNLEKLIIDVWESPYDSTPLCHTIPQINA